MKLLSIDKQEVINLYKQGLSSAEIASKFNCSAPTIRLYLENSGIPRRKSSQYLRIAKDFNMIRELYLNKKLECAQIAEQLGCSEDTIRQRLIGLGIYPHRQRVSHLVTEMTKLREKGSSILNIARDLHCRPSSVSYYLKKSGFPIDPLHRKIKVSDRPIIKDLYVNKELCSAEIAGRFNCTPTAIQYIIRQMGCSRSISEANKIAYKKGRMNTAKKDKISDGHGYTLIKNPEHPRAHSSGYVLEHILVWEKYHNRRVPEGYAIHHLNGIKADNRPENLVAMPRKRHDSITHLEPYKKRIRQLEIENHQLRRTLEDSQMIMYMGEN